MGGCESKNNQQFSNLINPKQQRQKNYQNNKDIEEITQKFNRYISEDKFLDILDKKYNLNDPIFKLIRKEEKKILKNFYISKKEGFNNDMTYYLNNQNLNFITLLTKQIISNEGGRDKFKQKIKEQIEYIYNNEEESKINYLTVMILGKTGAGKSCLVNNILFQGKEIAKEGFTERVTTQRRIYKSKHLKYLRLVDTVGIEINKSFNAQAVQFQASQFIQQQMTKNNFNDFVHCIWYCVNSNRFEKEEKKLVEQLIKTVGSTKIPIIIVLAQAFHKERVQTMTKDIKAQNFEDVIAIIAKPMGGVQGESISAYGLDELIQVTLKRCKGALNMEMKQTMIRNFKDQIKKDLFSENSSYKALIK